MERHLERRIEQPSLPVAVFEGDAGDPRTAVPGLNPQGFQDPAIETCRSWSSGPY